MDSRQSLFRQRIEQVVIEEEIQRSFLDYAMSVIVARALPDVRDGLKPVHRRILYVDAGGRPPRPTARAQVRVASSATS